MASTMLVIPFWIGQEAYAVASEDLYGILPRPHLRSVPGGPAGLLGVFSYRGQWTPVLDAHFLLSGAAARPALATRVLLCHTPSAGAALGLLCERVTDALTVDAEAWSPPGVKLGDAPWLGPLQTTGGITVQRLFIPHLLTPELAAALTALSPA